MRIALQNKKFFESSFLSCEKDCELLLRELFINNQPYSDDLKRLLVINNQDCLSNKSSTVYKNKIAEMTLPKLMKDGYIRLSPKLTFGEHEEMKSYIHMLFDNIMPTNTNDHFRDMNVFIDVLCPTDSWYLGDYMIRPLKICGYIDAMLNKNRFTGIGTLQLQTCSEIVLNENLAGYCMMYRAVHGDDDTFEENPLLDE